jgi:hypothetical protein
MRADVRERILALLTAPGPYPDNRVGEITISADRVAYQSPILSGAGFSVWYRPDTSAGSAPRWCSDLALPRSSRYGARPDEPLVYLYGPEALAEVERLCRLARQVMGVLKGVEEVEDIGDWDDHPSILDGYDEVE